MLRADYEHISWRYQERGCSSSLFLEIVSEISLLLCVTNNLSVGQFELGEPVPGRNIITTHCVCFFIQSHPMRSRWTIIVAVNFRTWALLFRRTAEVCDTRIFCSCNYIANNHDVSETTALKVSIEKRMVGRIRNCDSEGPTREIEGRREITQTC